MKALTVVYDRWDDGWWVSRIPAVVGVHSNGRTIEEARRRVREALSLAEEEGWNAKKAMSVELIDDVHLDARARQALDDRTAALRELQQAAKRVEETTERAIHELGGTMGLSVRDIAAFLGLSHQRIQQLSSSGGYGPERSVRNGEAREAVARYRVDRRAAAKRKR